jgi:transcriptional regulator with XRE-family HTH domain
MSLLSRKTIAKKLLESKKFRETYVFEQIKRHIPFQVRTMRTERDWSQAKAGEAIGKPQNVVSRLESPAYGKLTLQTLLDIAHGFDVGLVIKFVPFSRLVKEYEDVSFEALSAESVSDEKEAEKIKKWALGEPMTAITNPTVTTLSASQNIFRKIVEDMKVWHSRIDVSKDMTGIPITITAHETLYNILMEGKTAKVESTSTDQNIASGYRPPESIRTTEPIPNFLPTQSTMLDFTKGLPF